jgi:hypothetical protein
MTIVQARGDFDLSLRRPLPLTHMDSMGLGALVRLYVSSLTKVAKINPENVLQVFPSGAHLHEGVIRFSYCTINSQPQCDKPTTPPEARTSNRYTHTQRTAIKEGAPCPAVSIKVLRTHSRFRPTI